MEDSQIAAALSASLAERIGAQRFELWFSSQAELCVRAGGLTVRAVSTFVRDWIRANLADEIRACWETIADSAGTENIRPEHISEAIQNRSLDRSLYI